MHIAACKNNNTMVSFLLDMGANPNVVNKQGQTPVMNAAEYGHVQCLQVLAEAGSDMTGTFPISINIHHCFPLIPDPWKHQNHLRSELIL